MFATRPARLGAAPYTISNVKHNVCSPGISRQPLYFRSQKLLALVVFSKSKDDKDHISHNDDIQPLTRSSELQTYIDRERFLFAELAATRCQVDKLLDQQQQLLAIIARLSGWSDVTQSGLSASSLTSAPSLPSNPSPSAISWSPNPSAPQPRTAPATTAPVTPVNNGAAAAGSTRSSSTSSTSSSSHIPAPASLAELFGSAAAVATHSTTAAAAASVAAAIAAVDTGDILSLRDVLPDNKLPLPSAPTAPPAQQELRDAPAALSASSSMLPSSPASISDMLDGFIVSTSTGQSMAGRPGAAAAAEQPAAEVPSDLPVEVAKAAPTDAPPDLVLGDDDIFWISKLHAALEERGFYPGDDDLENWFFGETTQAAVLAFQASERLPETGVVDRPTWTTLLGQDVAQELYDRAASSAAATPSPTEVAGAVVAASPEGSERATAATAGTGPQAVAAASGAASGAVAALDRWPVLREGDGGREVHALQVALSNQGYYCGEDDMRWWQFGDTTLMALKVFQSCGGLPESGVSDERTWLALLGTSASPAQIYSLKMDAASDDEDGGFEQDMEGVSEGRVWLLGEQRWEERG